MRSNRMILLFIAMLFLFSSAAAIVVNPPTIVRDFTSPGTYYHSSGNLAYFAVDHVMTFTQVVVASSYVQFNNTKFNISSPNRINISLDYLGATMNGSSGTTIISFYAQTTTGTAKFNISGLTSGRQYTVYKNNVSYNTSTANSTGWLYFRNNAWSTAYFEIVLLGTLPSVTTNASTGVEETNATLNGYVTSIAGITSEGFNYGTTVSYGSLINLNLLSWFNRTTLDVGHQMDSTHSLRLANKLTSFTGYPINISFPLWKKDGTTYGNVTATIRYTSNSTIICQSDAINASSLNVWPVQWHHFVFNTSKYISSTDIYVSIEYGGPSYVDTYAQSGPVGTNWYSYSGGAWHVGTLREMCMRFCYLNTNETTISYNTNLLAPGTLYHYRAFATNSNGTSYGSDMTLLTKPNEPTALSITDTASGQQTLTWTHGTGYNQSVVRGTIGSYPASPQTGTAIQNSSANSVVRTGLSRGNVWYYRVWEYTVYGSSFKFSDTYTQGHMIVQNISTLTTNATIGIEETNATLKGYLSNNGSSPPVTCGFWYDTDSGLPYATNHSNGVVANHTAFTYNAPLSPGTRYYARAWASNAMGFVYGSETSFVTKPNNPDTALFSISSNTRSLDLTWTKGTGANKTLIVRKLGAYPLTKTDGTIVYNGTGSSYTNTGLTPGVGYAYRAWSYTSWGTTWQFSDLNASACEITKPEGPHHGNVTLLNLYTNGTMKVRLNWTKGQGANNTLVIKNNAHPPTSWTDGTIIYNGTGTSFDAYIPYLIGSPEYYSACSYAAWIINPHLYEISANMTTITLGALGGLLINCYDETTGVNLTFNVQISNHNGSSVYIKTGCVNTEIINATLCPNGIDITVIISSANHSQRTYLLDIYPGIIYLMNTYLPQYIEPGEPGYDVNETYSSLYYLKVVETIETEYTQVDAAVEGALVTVKRYVNTTDTFDIVSSAYTDANGYINLYMLPFVHYKVFISKAGYDDMISDYIPAPPNAYGQTAEKVFRIVLNETTPVIPSIETLFTNITYSFFPTNTRHETNYTFYYNISSSDGKIEWFKMLVWYYNGTTNTWVLLSTQNDSTHPNGGSLNYTLPNVSGKYVFECFFKKVGYPEYEFGETGSLIQFIVFLRQGLRSVPDYAWFIITIILMIVGMGFFMRYFASGIATGYIGLGIFAMMLLLKDIQVPLGGVGGPISGWVIWGITFLIYTVGVFLYSRI